MSKRKNKSQDFVAPLADAELSAVDVISLLFLKNIKVKDFDYALDHVSILKSSIRTTYEIVVKDIDGEVYTFNVELKTYK